MEENGKLPWRQELRRTIPKAALKEVNIGSWGFTSIEAYFALEIADRIFGPWGQGYWLEIHSGFPQILAKEVVTSGTFYYVDPETGKPCPHGIQVSGGCKIVHGVGFAMKGAETSCISNALSRLMFGIEIYSGGKVSMDTYGMHHAWGNDDSSLGGAAQVAPATRATEGEHRSEAPPGGRGRPSSSSSGRSRGGPPIGWVRCSGCGAYRKPFYNAYGPYILCKECETEDGGPGLYTNLTIDQAEVAAEAGLWGDKGAEVVDRLRAKRAKSKRRRPPRRQPRDEDYDRAESDAVAHDEPNWDG